MEELKERVKWSSEHEREVRKEGRKELEERRDEKIKRSRRKSASS